MLIMSSCDEIWKQKKTIILPVVSFTFKVDRKLTIVYDDYNSDNIYIEIGLAQLY